MEEVHIALMGDWYGAIVEVDFMEIVANFVSDFDIYTLLIIPDVSWWMGLCFYSKLNKNLLCISPADVKSRELLLKYIAIAYGKWDVNTPMLKVCCRNLKTLTLS